MKKLRLDQNLTGWLYMLPAILFLGVFMVYPLIDVLIYSVEENYNFASQVYSGYGFFNYSYVLHDTYFVQALKNTFIIVIITVPVSTGLALLISLGLSSIGKVQSLFQTVYFLPYVTNTDLKRQQAEKRRGRVLRHHSAFRFDGRDTAR